MHSLASARPLWRTLALAACLPLALGPLAAQAAKPFGTLTFIEPTGTVQDTDTIDVWVRLTLDANSEPLSIVGSQPQWASSVADYVSGQGEFYLSVSSVYTNVFVECSGNFFNGCDPGAYKFDFNGTGANTFYSGPDVSLAPGASFDYIVGSFTPVGGAAPAGTYTFYNTGATVTAFGSGYKAKLNPDGSVVTDASGNPVYQQETDIDGNPVFESVQTPVYVPLLDADGNPVLDGLGQPTFEQATDPVTGDLLFDSLGKPIYLQATDPISGELLFTTTQKPKPAVFNDLFGGSFTIASNGCSSYDPPGACTVFTREVMASNVPEVGTLKLSALGLLMMGLALAARRRA